MLFSYDPRCCGCSCRHQTAGIPIARVELVDSRSIESVNSFLDTDYPVAPSLFLEFHGNKRGNREGDFSMKCKEILGILCILSLLFILYSCSSEESKTNAGLDGETITLRYAFFAPDGTIPAVKVNKWAEEVEVRTEGKVKIDIFYGGSLLEANTMFEGDLIQEYPRKCLKILKSLQLFRQNRNMFKVSSRSPAWKISKENNYAFPAASYHY